MDVAPPRLAKGHDLKRTRFLETAIMWIWIVVAVAVVLYVSGSARYRDAFYESGLRAGSLLGVWWRLESQIAGLAVLFGGGVLLSARILNRLDRRLVGATVLLVFGLIVLGTYRLRPAKPLDAYCRGFAAGLGQAVGEREVRSRLLELRRSEDRVRDGYLKTNLVPEFLDRAAVILVGPMAPSSPWVSYRFLGGAVAISLDGPPPSPGRNGDRDYPWTNGIWISLREE
jgi:hypothetical protein